MAHCAVADNAAMSWWLAAAAISLCAWVYLAAANGSFWRAPVGLPGRVPGGAADEARSWPEVVAVVPARDEAEVLPRTLPTLVEQRYDGPFRVVVVDDDSADATGDIARAIGADVIRSDGPPAGWVGKVAAMAAGVDAATEARFLLFTDADIAFAPGTVEALVTVALDHDLDLVSYMVRLRTRTFWERQIVPAFVYFFSQLYPFARVNTPPSRVAAAAGGCMLARRDALLAAGGLERIRDALIDDVSLARLLKRRRSGARIWLAHATDVESLRAYPTLPTLWNMVARSAYTQLRYSPTLLAGSVAGLLLVYAIPVAAVVVGAVTGDVVLSVVGAAAWLTMALTYVPTLRYYGLSPLRATGLPAVALLYAAMTVDSALRHARGRGGAWKGRHQPKTPV
jgi:hopene-associated glycosyltransferase HpnB